MLKNNINTKEKQKEKQKEKEKQKKIDIKLLISNFKIKSKISIIIIVGIIVTILALIFSVILYFDFLKYKPYKKYEINIKTYGFDKIYDNGKAKTSESVTKSEAIKMVIASTLNINDISGIQNAPSEEYSNAIWVEFAQKKEIITKDEINKEKANEKASYADVIRYFANAKIKLLGKNLDTETVSNLKDFEKYKPDEKSAISDSIYNGIIKEKTDKLNAYNKVFKGQVNEIVKNYVEKYNTITPNGEKLNVDPAKIPSNVNEYTFTLATVDKEVYEKPYIIDVKENFKNPKNTYIEKKDLFLQIVERVEFYYNTLLNIDYTNINPEQFGKSMEEYAINGISSNEVDNYMNYIKTNKIRIEGNAKAQAPIIYFDGTYYRMRVKLEFKVLYSDTKENLLFGDLEYKKYSPYKKVIYNNESNVIYIDTALESNKLSNSLYIVEKPIYKMMIDKLDPGMNLVDVGE